MFPASWRHLGYRLMETRDAGLPARVLNGLLILLIILSVSGALLETIPSLAQRHAQLFYAVEVISVAVFSVEYLGRLWWSVEDPRYARPLAGRLRYALTPMALIDLLAILPFYLALFVGMDLRLLRMLRVLRMLKLSRYSPAVTMLLDVLREERDSLVVTFFILITILIFASTGIYAFEREAQPVAFGSIPAAMWWAVATLTTVGYGDVTPITVEGKLFAALITLTGIGMVSLPAGIIASGFTEALRQRREDFAEMVTEALNEGPLDLATRRRLDENREELGLSAHKAQRIIRRTRERLDRRPH